MLVNQGAGTLHSARYPWFNALIAPAAFCSLPEMTTSLSTVPLNSQVGGHPGVLTTEDGSLLIKAAIPLELQFYQSLNSDSTFALLRPFVPEFYGTLKLEGKIDDTQGEAGAGITLKTVGDHVKDEDKDE